MIATERIYRVKKVRKIARKVTLVNLSFDLKGSIPNLPMAR